MSRDDDNVGDWWLEQWRDNATYWRDLAIDYQQRAASLERAQQRLQGAVSALRIAEHELSGREDFDPDVRVEVLRMVREAIAAVEGR